MSAHVEPTTTNVARAYGRASDAANVIDGHTANAITAILAVSASTRRFAIR